MGVTEKENKSSQNQTYPPTDSMFETQNTIHPSYQEEIQINEGKNQKNIKQNNNTVQQQKEFGLCDGDDENMILIDINKCSLAKHPRISQCMKWFVPVFLILNIGMYLYCNIAVGAKLQYTLQVGGLSTQHYDLGDFTVYGSVNQMWKAGVYPLALVILCFSGLWPYVKLLGMLFCWFMPQTHLKFQKREKLLQILDVTGKWSLIDSYFMIMMCVGFQVIISENILGLPASFDVTVTPLFDFYCFMMATCLSLFLTQVVIQQHRMVVSNTEGEHNILLNKVVRLGYNKGYKKVVVPLLVVISILLLIVGYFIDVFTFHFHGLAGWALKEDKNATYSMWQVGYLLPSHTYEPDTFGIRALQAVYFVFSLFIPVIFLIMIIVLYTTPMKLRVAKKVFQIAEIIHSWASMDVLALCVIISMFQIGATANYMVGANCDGINQLVQLISNLYPGKFDFGGYEECFYLTTSLNIGGILLFISALQFMFIGNGTLRSLQKKLEIHLELAGDRKSDCGSFIDKSLIDDEEEYVQSVISNRQSMMSGGHKKSMESPLLA